MPSSGRRHIAMVSPPDHCCRSHCLVSCSLQHCLIRWVRSQVLDLRQFPASCIWKGMCALCHVAASQSGSAQPRCTAEASLVQIWDCPCTPHSSSWLLRRRRSSWCLRVLWAGIPRLWAASQRTTSGFCLDENAPSTHNMHVVQGPCDGL